MITVHPIRLVLHQDWLRCLRKQPLLLLWRVVAAILLAAFYYVRALLIPALASIGAAFSLANSATADEIVLSICRQASNPRGRSYVIRCALLTQRIRLVRGRLSCHCIRL